MDTHYQPLYKQAAALQYRFHDYTHAAAHDPSALAIRQQLHGLTNDLARGRDPRAIDRRMSKIQTQIKKAQIYNPTAPGMPGQPMLSKTQGYMLHNNFQQMRQSIKAHPGF